MVMGNDGEKGGLSGFLLMMVDVSDSAELRFSMLESDLHFELFDDAYRQLVCSMMVNDGEPWLTSKHHYILHGYVWFTIIERQSSCQRWLHCSADLYRSPPVY